MTEGGEPRRLPEYIVALDGLRGLAVLLTFLVHMVWDAPDASLAGKLFHQVTMAGWVGVDLFFVLSGFLITRILLRAKGSENYFSSFYARRTLRIFPLYYGVLFVLLVLFPALSAGWRDAMSTLVQGRAYYWAYCWNLLLPFRRFDEALGFNHFWSLMVEEQFYLAWPLVVALCSRTVLPRLCALCVAFSVVARFALASHGYEPLHVYQFTPVRIDGLAVGGLLAWQAETRGFTPRFVAWAKGAFIVLAVAQGWMAVHDDGFFFERPWVERVGLTTLAFFWASLLVVVMTAAPSSLLRALFESRAMRFAGKYSYGAYVYHMPILAFVLEPLGVRAWLSTTLHSPWLGALAYLGLGTVLVFGLAVASYELVEKRLLTLKRYFEYARHARRSGPIGEAQTP